jgi:hypothetical protein
VGFFGIFSVDDGILPKLQRCNLVFTLPNHTVTSYLIYSFLTRHACSVPFRNLPSASSSTGGGAPGPPNLHRSGCWSWSPLHLLTAPAATGGRGTSFLRSGLVVRVRFYLLWSVVGMVGAAFCRINLPQIYLKSTTTSATTFRAASWS